jgi:hypothetical protein
MADEQLPQIAPRDAGVEPAVVVESPQRRMIVRQVTDDELDQLRFSSPSVALTFFGIALGAAVAFGTVFFGQGKGDNGHTMFGALFFSASILAAFFAAAAFRAYSRGSALLTRIRGR